MATLKVKDSNFILTPRGFTLGFKTFSSFLEPYLLANGLGNLFFMITLWYNFCHTTHTIIYKVVFRLGRSMDYDRRFTLEKSKWYSYAVSKYPNAMKQEFTVAAAEVDCKEGDCLVNIPGACVPIEKYISRVIQYRPFEINPTFASVVDMPVCSLSNIPLESKSVDRILSLAALHHTSIPERLAFLEECKRLLKPGGKIIIGDVLDFSNPALWLNEFVNRWNATGHTGVFWSESDCALFTEVGLEVSYKVHKYSWLFSSFEGMIDFCRHLFGLDLASDETIAKGLIEYLKPTQDQEGWHLPWELAYFVSTMQTSDPLLRQENNSSPLQD